MLKIVIEILIFLAMLAAAFMVLVRKLESVGVFFPKRRLNMNPSELGLNWEDAYFKTGDSVKINGWFLKNPQALSTVIFAHGNAGNMSDRMLRIKFFYDLGLNVLIFDYRGYGNSEGKPSEAGMYLDAQGAYDYLAARGDVNMKNIILYGASIGGVAVIDLAVHRPAALLVVESSFTNATDMAHVHYPFVPGFVLSLKFNSFDKVKTLALPKLFIHSPEDEVVPYWIGQKLFESAAEPKEFLKIKGGHNDGSITVDSSAAEEFIRVLKSKDLI
jgi:uncharacterized protein